MFRHFHMYLVYIHIHEHFIIVNLWRDIKANHRGYHNYIDTIFAMPRTTSSHLGRSMVDRGCIHDQQDSFKHFHYRDVIMNAMASQITNASIVCSPVCSGADQRKHQSSTCYKMPSVIVLQWSQNERHGVSNHRHLDSLLSRFFRRT